MAKLLPAHGSDYMDSSLRSGLAPGSSISRPVADALTKQTTKTTGAFRRLRRSGGIKTLSVLGRGVEMAQLTMKAAGIRVGAPEDGWTRLLNCYGSLAKLPPELRYKIFHSVLRDIWEFKDPERLETRPPGSETPANVMAVLVGCVGLLSTNKTLRREAVLMVCQKTIFRLNDMDHAISLLRAIGSIGRENIQRLHLPWASGSDSDELWRRFPEREDNYLKLPSKHASMCVDLLRECISLTHLHIQISEDVLNSMSKESFKTDPGIFGLSCLRIASVEIYDIDDRISMHDYAVWLKSVVEGGESRADCVG